jgi:integrase
MQKTAYQNNNKAYDNFLHSIRSPSTKVVYANSLKRFADFMEADSYDQLLSLKPKQAEDRISAYIDHLKEQKLAPRTVRSLVTAVKTFYIRNRRSLNWEWLSGFLPEQVKVVEDRMYTKDEIRKILDKCDERKRVMVLLLLSTGMRIGALPLLKLRHLKKWEKEGIYQFTVYAGTKDQYATFCTPECTQALDSYLDFRKRFGETLTDESPLLREQFNKDKADKPQAMKLWGIIAVLNNLLYEAGVREKGKPHTRKNVMRFHAFRKYANSMMHEAGVDSVVKEMLLGHSVGLEESYLRKSDKQLLYEYLKVVGLLTVSNEKALLLQLEKLREDVESIEYMKDKYHEMKLQNEQLQGRLEAHGTDIEAKIEEKDQKIGTLADSVTTLSDQLAMVLEQNRMLAKRLNRLEKTSTT